MRSREQLNPDREESALDRDVGKETIEQEIMSAEDILNDVKEKGYKFFDLEKVRSELSERGVEDKDIQVAVDLMACITGLNEGTGVEGDVSLEFSIAQNEFGDVAGFVSSEENDTDIYTVYAKGVSDNITKTISKIPEVDRNGNSMGNYDSWEKPTLEEILISTASHEARHRLQHHELPMINPENLGDVDDGLFKGIIEYVRLLFEEERKQYGDEGKSTEYIDHKTNLLEFDARVIEMMTLINLRSGTNKKELQRLLKYEGKS